MTKFRQLSQDVFASPQIELSDIADAKELGIGLIVNNRPDGEEPSAMQEGDVAKAAQAAGIDYTAIPIGHSGFSEPQVDQMISALARANGKVLAYCRSGTRSTLLWALAQAKSGMSPADIAQAARNAGYDITPIQPMIDMFASR